MTTKLKAILDSIDEVLMNASNADNQTVIQLWAVLTALRGPDDENDDLKMDTTAVIRTAAFPKTASSCNGGDRWLPALFADKRDKFACPNKCLHFYQHARAAAVALGLKNELP